MLMPALMSALVLMLLVGAGVGGAGAAAVVVGRVVFRANESKQK